MAQTWGTPVSDTWFHFQVQRLGAAVLAEARRCGLGRAHYGYIIMDGAVWLWDLATDRFAGAILTLDLHHASEMRPADTRGSGKIIA